MSVKIGRNDPCWCGSGRKYKTCHQSFDEKIEKYREAGCIVPTHDLIKTPKDIEGKVPKLMWQYWIMWLSISKPA